jgi:tRNA threonylcarbamoyladenosine biosynthesis protein TsaE
MNSVYLRNEASTEKLGRMLGNATHAEVSADDVSRRTMGARVFLAGELGAGKTSLTRGVLREFGYAGAVKSPTYTLVEPYEEQEYNLYHFDLYRLSDPEEVEFLGVLDYFGDANLCIVEWAEKGKGYLPDPDIEITLTVEGEGRRARWEPRSEKGEVIAHRLSVLAESIKSGTGK